MPNSRIFGNSLGKEHLIRMSEVTKKRGRPPKDPAPAGEEPSEPVVKRGRGRPKGKGTPKPKPTGPKRPRGRPKGSTKKKPDVDKDKPATPKKTSKKSSE